MARRGYPDWIAAAGALLVIACAGSIPQPGEGHVRWAAAHGLPSSLDSLAEGRRRYVMKCDGCHTLYAPRKHAPEDWPSWLDSMRVEIRKAEGDLSDSDTRLIRDYLMAASGHHRDSVAVTKAPGPKPAEGE